MNAHRGLGLKVQGSKFRVWGDNLRNLFVWGLGFQASGLVRFQL